ncbi:Asp-tRNA(Asn)/Glu-tRNA(Gln) amidotransferase GatCAB subunit C [Lewinellaceae bacterium SD302]|nr:Asp-tRNA(Asn)/Glu-tRNA(Gln) amidotransferase GatCAB subunit C [Lewinellaceae bacterium SD302]
MNVDDALLSRLTRLTKLELDTDRREQLKGDLKNILAMVDKLKEVDVEGVEPLRYLTEVENDLRPDEVAHEIDREKALRNAPDQDQDGQFFRVPRVVK